MTQHELILIENFSRGLLRGSEAAIYSSCQSFRKKLASSGEHLNFDHAFHLWCDYIGFHILDILSTDKRACSLFGTDRYKIFFIVLEKIEENNFIFEPNMVYETIEEQAKKTVA